MQAAGSKGLAVPSWSSALGARRLPPTQPNSGQHRALLRRAILRKRTTQMDSSDRRGISGRIRELALYIVVAVGVIMILIGLLRGLN